MSVTRFGRAVAAAAVVAAAGCGGSEARPAVINGPGGGTRDLPVEGGGAAKPAAGKAAPKSNTQAGSAPAASN